MSDESGYTLVELLVGMFVTMVVLGAIMMIVQVATRHQDRVAEQVAANQRARPAMTWIVNQLHAACLSPGLAPVLEGSDDNELILLSKAGDDVSPIPDKHIFTYAGGMLSESVYEGTDGEAPDWEFAATPTTRSLIDDVGEAALGEGSEIVPVFRYYAYDGGEVEETPLVTSPNGLSAADAARTVQVDVAFTVTPSSAAPDQNASIALTDSATLRIEPASEDSAQVNLPCV
ncbi:MAG TPA: prepilin-type N-terminal cleavage/methylation domain-containing protein [Solirubrobacterales bacterium]|nr:prepilin-type N-terminal cleavage/methylation domain-containing protein [Solirubrobacterales bacterium]